MNTQTRYEIRLGLIALTLAGLLYTLTVVMRGAVDIADPGACCRAAVSPNFVPAWTIGLVGAVLQLFGLFGLYRYLTYQAESLIALLAFVLSIAATALFLQIPTFYAVNAPVIAELYQQGNQEVIAVVEANFTGGLGLALLSFRAVGWIIGPILSAIAIWRDGRLPRWTAVLLALSFLLLIPVTFITELSGAVLLLISAGMMAWKGWQESVGIRRQVQ
jgi:hypothetical protein